VVGVGDAEDRGGLGRAEGAQADPEPEVAVEAAEVALVEALGGELMGGIQGLSVVRCKLTCHGLVLQP
jgi:hypothetical protein